MDVIIIWSMDSVYIVCQIEKCMRAITAWGTGVIKGSISFFQYAKFYFQLCAL